MDIKELICQIQEAELAMLPDEDILQEQCNMSVQFHNNMNKLVQKVERQKKVRAVQRGVTAVAAGMILLLAVIYHREIVEAAQKAVQWIEEYIDTHFGNKPDENLSAQVDSEMGTEILPVETEGDSGPDTGHTAENENVAENEGSQATAGPQGNLYVDEFDSFTNSLNWIYVDDYGLVQILHFKKCDEDYFEIWSTVKEEFYGSLRTSEIIWGSEKYKQYYAFSQDCNEDGENDIILLMVENRTDRESVVFTIECFLHQGGEFRAGEELGYPVIH